MALPKPEQQAYDGLANLAHAIRRSVACYIAMQVTEPGSSIEVMLANADRLAAWIGGRAEASADDQRTQEFGPLGKAWPPED